MCCAPGLLRGAEEGTGIIVATPWEVRRSAAELIEDLTQKRDELPRLLDRVQALLADHGADPVPYGKAWTPLSQAMAAELERLGLADAYRAAYGPAAERELRELLAAPVLNETALTKLAQHYPGTAAAQETWRVLANRAWDRGHLGSYLHRARNGGETIDPELRKRVIAAREMLRPKHELDLPATLDGLVEMWSIADLPLSQQRGTLSVNRRDDEEIVPARFAFSSVDRDVAAVSDGRIAFVFDPLFGERVGAVHELVDEPAGGTNPEPLVDGLGFVIPAMETGGTPLLLALDHNGERRWRSNIGTEGASGLSSPVILDDLIAIAVTVPTGGGAELRVVALERTTGEVRWNVLVAKDPRGIRHRFRHFNNPATPPSCTVHAGALVVLSHSGILAELGVNGQLRRVWNYVSAAAAAPQLLDYRGERLGAVRSDGRYLVATPADTSSLLIIGPDDTEPQIYTGLGASDGLLDVADGHALLAGTRITSIDLTTANPDWTKAVGAAAAPRWGRLGRERALVVLDSPEVIGQQIHLLSRRDGKQLGERPIGGDDSLTVAGDLLVRAGPDTTTEGDTRIIVGYGDERGFQRLRERSEQEPTNPRPLIGLASLYRARGQLPEAYDHLTRALELGAPPAMAEAAARLARRLVDLSLGGEGFATAVTRLERLGPFVPGIAAEADWWRGRNAELAGDIAASAAAYRKAASGEIGLVSFVDGLAVDRHALAAMGLFRIGQGPRPAWAQVSDAPAAAIASTASWALEQRFLTDPIVTDSQILGYTGGHVTALSLTDASVLWRRTAPEGDPAFLGVRMVGNGGNGSVRIELIPGSAAEAAGFKDGDHITHFNTQELAGFKSLVDAITASGPAGEFTAQVLRADDTGTSTAIELSGSLGSQLLQPVTASDGLLLCRRMTLVDQARGGWRLAPDRMRDPTVEVLDLNTGTVVWRKQLLTAGDRQTQAEPILLPGGILLVVEDDGLEALDLRDKHKRLWTLPEVGAGTQALQILPGGLVLLAGTHGTARVVDARNGALLMELPVRSDTSLLLADGDCFARLPDGRLAAWDIGVGRQRWTRDRGEVEPLLAAGDAVYVLDAQRRLAVLDRPSGKTRRTYGAWPTIHETLVTAKRLFVHARNADGVDAIAAVDRATGSVLWGTKLPERLELRGRLFAVGDGVGCVLDTLDQPPGLLVLDNEGEIAMAHLLADDESVVASAAGVIANGPRGVRLLPPLIPHNGVPLDCPLVAAGKDLPAAAADAQEVGTWNEVGKGRYLVARSGKDLLILVRVAQGSGGVTIHLADQGPEANTPTQSLVVRPGHSPVFDRRDGGWHLSGVRRINQDEAEWTVVIRLTPPQLRLAATGIVIRAAADGEVDGPAAPWWLRNTWRTVSW
jgi:outer membrane protein assembly factor BamB